MRLHVALSFLVFFTATNVSSQTLFESSTQISDKKAFRSGLPVAVIDMNEDLLDDIVFLEYGTILHIAYQNWDGNGFETIKIDTVGNEAQWAIAIADLDDNGWKDIVIGGAYDDVKIYFQDSSQFEKLILPAPNLYVQALNIVDINDDGSLDLFLCNDIGYNKVYWNRSGQFVSDTTGLFKDLPQNVSKGNYGAEWIDVEGDGDMDLYIAKCFANAQTFDPKRINQLYINKGNGVFKEEADKRGVASAAQSWTGHFVDYDCDGDFDLVVSNHDQTAEVFKNDGLGFFEEVQGSNLQISGPVIQTLDADFDLDGWQDIIAGGFPDFLYRGSENGRFQNQSDQLGLYDLTSLAIGDLNNDGKSDVFATILDQINLPSPMTDRIFYNASRGHWLNIYIQGDGGQSVVQNALIKVYEKERIQTRMLRSGESYGVQNSFKMMFGLGENPEIDSVSIFWMNGNKQTVTEIEPDQYVLFHASGKAFKQSDISLPSKDTICRLEQIELLGPDGAMQYKWNGVLGEQNYTAIDAGFYQLEVTYDDGSKVKFPGSSVFKNVEFSSEIALDGDSILCDGENLMLSQKNGVLVKWNTGEISKKLTVEKTGWYYGTKLHDCDQSDVDSTYIQFLAERDNFKVIGDSIKKGEDALLRAIGQDAKWYRDSLDLNPFYIGPELTISNVLKDTQVFCSPYELFQPELIEIGETQVNALEPYHEDNANATMIFDVLQPVLLQSVRLKTDTPGARKIMLYNDQVVLINSKIVNLDTGWNEVKLDFALKPEDGRYRLTTDNDFNQQSLGTRSPRLASSYQAVSYPYVSEGLLRIIESQYGRDQYNYFYNWKVLPSMIECEGDKRSVRVLVDQSTSTHELSQNEDIKIFPNPTSGQIEMASSTDLGNVHILDCYGRFVNVSIQKSEGLNSFNYRLNIPVKGLYTIKWNSGARRVVIRK